MDYQIISDGSCDLPQELAGQRDIIIVPFYVSFGEGDYRKEMVEIGVRDFYEQMVADPKSYPKSSMPSVQDYVDVFEPAVKDGKAVLCICITTKFSGSMQSALNARSVVLESSPWARITVIDATINTVLQGLYVLEAAKLKEQGASYEEAIERLEQIKSSGRIFFSVGDMEYLKHGGRIGRLAGLAGSVLGIKPLITLKEGEIFPSGITRSRKKSMEKVIELLLAYLDERSADIHKYQLAVGYGYDYMEAVAFRDQILNTMERKGYPLDMEELPIRQIGATIGVHTGPYPIGIGIIEKA